ncbi:MAG: sigma 54-interacting transcriptional regulator [Myxococcales bacterium]|nr:sigma 54-interacting transcriptional regulator [Myxococcales bacterium]
MRRILTLAERAALSDATVLITGESGTGKERLARFIHGGSRRRDQPFVAINCGALPEALLESELFGHKKGAFTGAYGDAPGLFLAASGGTLLLDELGETPPAMQVKLLRALQERVIRPVGATKDVPVDVRVVAATNQDVERLVDSGGFRRDLFYRLRVIALELPPLRERRDDILGLARLFIAKTCRQNACGPCALSREALDAFYAYAWPGNVRELENAIERAVVLAEGQPKIELGDLPPELRTPPASRPASTGSTTGDVPATLAEMERRHILATLERCAGNRAATARALGIGENTLWRKLKAYRVPAAR